MSKRAALVIVLLVVVAGAAVWLFLGRGLGSREVRNVLLISIDTCRADYLGCYGFPRRITPNIDAVAKEAVLFENVVSPVPITLPAHASMLTGTTPLYHQAHDNGNYYVAAHNRNLAQILQQRGFRTGAIVSGATLDSDFGLDRGFETYDDRFPQIMPGVMPVERKAGDASRLAVDWLDKHKDERFFLFLHYFDPHLLYEPPPPFDSLFSDNLYAGEIAYTDFCIGQVIDKLKQLGLYDSTLLVITADHGEMLGEHGEKTHAYFIYQSALKVPLIFRLPGGGRPARISQTVGLIDVAPAICGLLGIEVPAVMQGKDLSGAVRTKSVDAAERYLYCESILPTIYGCNPLAGVVAGQWKYIHTTRPELYNLADDPNEQHNMAAQDPTRANLLRERLQRMMTELAYTGGSGGRATADARAIQRLESLGYVAAGAADDSFAFDPNREDPKDLIQFHDKSARANVASNNKRFAEATALCRELLAKRSSFALPHIYLAQMAFQQGNRSEGFSEYYRYLESVDPNWPDAGRPAEVFAELARKFFYLQKVHADLGVAYFEDGLFDKAITHFEHSLRLAPRQSTVHAALAAALKRQGRLDEAIERWRQAIVIDPAYPDAHYWLADALKSQGKLDEAVSHFEQALQLRPEMKASIYSVLGDISLRRGQGAKAVEYWTAGLQDKPESVQLLARLAFAYATDKPGIYNPDKAVELALTASRISQFKSPAVLRTLALAYATAGKFDEAVNTVNKAIELARSAGNTALVDKLQANLQQYQNRQSPVAALEDSAVAE